MPIPSLLLPRPRLLHPVPVVLQMMGVGQGQRAVGLGVRMESFLIALVIFLKVSDRFAVLRMGIQVEIGVDTGKTRGGNAAKQLFLGETA